LKNKNNKKAKPQFTYLQHIHHKYAAIHKKAQKFKIAHTSSSYWFVNKLKMKKLQI
jgi:hypothetical protein